MRLAAVLAAALLLSSCTWMRSQLGPAPVSTPAAQPAARPETPRPAHPRPHVEKPATPTPVAAPPQAAPPPQLDYSARCHAMATNRANDAKQLGANVRDQAKVETDTYRDCMAQSVK